MAARNVTRNNLIAGTFLLVALIAGVVISIVVADGFARLQARHEYIVRFDVQAGAHGLRPGAEVTLGGQPVGWVQRIDFHAPRDVPEAVDVVITVHEDIVLHEDARIHLQQPLLGAMSTVNISNPGDVEELQLRPGAVIEGTLAPPAVLAQAGLGAEQIRQMTDALKRLDSFTALLEENLEDYLDEFRAVLVNVRETSEFVKRRTPEWDEDFTGVLKGVRQATERLGPLADHVDERLEAAGKFVETLQRIVESNEEDVSEIVSEVRDLLPQIRAGVDRFTDAADTFESLAGRSESLVSRVESFVEGAESLFIEQVSNIRRTIANLRLASDQGVLAAREIRRQPWLLMHTPTRRERQRDAFFHAVREFATALSDLRDASESLEAILEAEAVGRIQPTRPVATAEEVRQRLEEARERYEEAERQLFEELQRRR